METIQSVPDHSSQTVVKKRFQVETLIYKEDFQRIWKYFYGTVYRH